MKTLFCVLGRSGAGKDTVVDRVCQLTGMKKVCSYTTRPKRINEGDTHIFIRPEDVDKYKDDIIAQTVIGDVEYFATVTQVLNSDFYIIHNFQDLEALVKFYADYPELVGNPSSIIEE